MPRHEGQRYVHTLVCQRLLECLQGGTVCRAVGRGKGGIGKAAGILRGIGKGGPQRQCTGSPSDAGGPDLAQDHPL